VNRFYTR